MTRETEETIVAIATPPGRGGLGVVRLSGDHALEILHALIRLPKNSLETRHATLGEFADPESGKSLDQVMVTGFRKPHSYTGEDVVEISCHGAPVILAYLVECCLARGARPAEPGEFTMRAFLNGRIDLTQAEAIRDLIDSRTLFQARIAAQQMEGSVSARLKPHKQALLELIAQLEAGIDFAEDDVSVPGWEEILPTLYRLRNGLGKLARGYEVGKIIHDGLSLAIIGRPNVGKSSLFNRLLNEERAIVTETPGTTRDLVAETASIAGIPLRLVDTAGIRETTDPVEKMGVIKSLQAIADSDLRLLVIDLAQGWTEEDADLLQKIYPLGSLLVACNKCDLPQRVTLREIESLIAASAQSLNPRANDESKAGEMPGFAPHDRSGARGDDASGFASSVAAGAGARTALATISGNERIAVHTVCTSARTGEGLPQLRDKMLSVAAPARDLDPGGEFITNLRHQQSIQAALHSLANAQEAATQRVPQEMVLLDLYDALHALDAITGSTTVDDVLGVIFSTFCVGK